MCKFIRIESYREFSKNEKFPEYIENIKTLYQKYSKFLSDDFSPFLNCNIADFIQALSPYFWVITDRNNRFAGFVYLDNFTGNNEKLYSAEVSVCFAKKRRGAYVRYCAKFFFKMCFDVFGLRKIKAQIYPQNFTVRKLLKDCGFQYESRLISETLRNGKPQDIEVYSLYRTYYYKNMR